MVYSNALLPNGINPFGKIDSCHNGSSMDRETSLSQNPDMGWVTLTKILPPRLREDIISRPRLLALLRDKISSHPITLICAPAGYGKTTLLVALHSTFSDLAFAWLSLDEDDNDPSHFLNGLIVALQRVIPTWGMTARAVLSNQVNPREEMRRVVGALINDVLEIEADPFVLVLDDLHVITEPAIYAALNYLLERLPPQMHIVVASRYDPPLDFARLRARGQFAELRLADLRFTLDETSTFLNGKLHFALPPDDLAMLQARTEGWPTGFRLLAGSLDRIVMVEDRRAFIQALAHTERYVFDFLAEEVLQRQESDVKTWLLETSILPELTPALCQAVTGRIDASTVLPNLYRRNLFLVAMDESNSSFRYHGLFAEFLRKQLAQEMPERVPELHRRAAEAQAQLHPERAIPHYLAVEAWDDAVRLIEQASKQLVLQGSLDTLRGYIQLLPSAIQASRPRLVYYLGICARQRGDLPSAQSLLEQALQGFEQIGDEAGQGDVLMELANVAGGNHDYARQQPLIQQALAKPLPPHGRAQLLIIRAWQSLYQGEWNQVDRYVTDAMQVTLESNEAGAFNVLALQLRIFFALLPNGAERLENYSQQVLLRYGDAVVPATAGAHSLLGSIHLLHGRITEASQEAEVARTLSDQLGGFVYIDNEIALALIRSNFIQSDYATVERLADEWMRHIEETSAAKPWINCFLNFKARAELLQGHVREAQDIYAQMCAAANPQDLPEAIVARLLIQALLETAERRYTVGERILRQARELQKKMRHTLVYFNATVSIAHLFHEWKHPEEASAEFAPMLAECERNGTPGLILQEGAWVEPLLNLAIERGVHRDIAMPILAMLRAQIEERRARPIVVPDTGSALTTREVEVLRLIATGASNHSIAEQLVITERTVKAHLTSIYDKLRVSSRTQAAVRARELRIV